MTAVERCVVLKWRPVVTRPAAAPYNMCAPVRGFLASHPLPKPDFLGSKALLSDSHNTNILTIAHLIVELLRAPECETPCGTCAGFCFWYILKAERALGQPDWG
jgi:hypothetical protein